MSDHWKRWRGYMDDVEEALRAAAEDLRAAEADAARQHERERWPLRQRQIRLQEIARLALDTPFLGDLLRVAAREHGIANDPRHDRILRPWDGTDDDSVEPELAIAAPAPPADEERAPARLVRAEIALAARTRSLVTVLEDLTVPRNASAVLRTAEGLGLHELHFVHRTGRLVAQDAVSRRAQAWLDVQQHRHVEPVLDDLEARGYRILVADFDPAAQPLEEVPIGPRTAVVLGSEQRGVTAATRARAHAAFFIPIAGLTTYLNVSVAAAIALYALDRRLRAEGWRQPLDPDDLHRVRERWYRALGEPNPVRVQEYARWLSRPPIPQATTAAAVPSREKLRGAHRRPRR